MDRTIGIVHKEGVGSEDEEEDDEGKSSHSCEEGSEEEEVEEEEDDDGKDVDVDVNGEDVSGIHHIHDVHGVHVHGDACVLCVLCVHVFLSSSVLPMVHRGTLVHRVLSRLISFIRTGRPLFSFLPEILP